MNQVVTDIWPFLITALIAAMGWQFRESYILKTKVAVLETTVKDLIKDVENMQKRQDSHSKKQDEIVSLITDFKLEVVKQIGDMASDLKSLNRLMSVNDEGIKFKKQ